MSLVPSSTLSLSHIRDRITPVLSEEGARGIEIQIGGSGVIVEAFQRAFPSDINPGIQFRRSSEGLFSGEDGVWLRDYWFINPLNGEKLSCPEYCFHGELSDLDPSLRETFQGREKSLFPKGQIVHRGCGGFSDLQFLGRRDASFTYLRNLYLEGGNIQFFDFQGKRGMLVGASAILHSANLMWGELAGKQNESAESIFNRVVVEISRVFQMDPENVLVLAHSELHIDLEVLLAPDGKVFLSDPTATHEMDCTPLSKDRVDVLNEIYEYNKKVLEKFGFQVFPMPRDFHIGEIDRSYCFNGLFFHDKRTNVSVFATNALTVWNSEYSTLDLKEGVDKDSFKSRLDGLSIEEKIYNYLKSHGILTLFVPREGHEGGGVRCLSRELRTKQSLLEPLHFIPFNSESLQKFMPAKLILSCRGELPGIQLLEEGNQPVAMIEVPENNELISYPLIFNSIQANQSKLIEVCADGKTLFKRVLYPGTVTCLKISPSIIADALSKSKRQKRIVAEKVSRTPFENDFPDGRVAFVLANGDQYEGEFKKGFIHGCGTLIYTDGGRYEGKFQRGLRHGQGKFIDANGDIYVGMYKYDLRHGSGRYINAKQEIYLGDFKDDLKNGYGIVIYPNHQWQECEYKDGELIKIHNKSTLDRMQFGRQLCGDWYNCEIVNGVFCGRGLYYFQKRDEYYIGDFQSNYPDGQGTLVYANGGWYQGEFKRGFFDGLGTLVYANGDRYQGEFKRGFFDGLGTLTYANGDRYEGEFKNECFDGVGTLTYANGEKYQGEFKNGQAVIS